MAIAVIQPALTNAAIIAALGFTPASSNNIGAMADGSAAAPALSFALDTDIGFFRPVVGTYGGGLGVSVQGKEALEVFSRTLNGGDDNAWLILGTDQEITNQVNDTFVWTIGTQNKNITGPGARYIGGNIGTNHLYGTDTETMTGQQCQLEMDKIDVYQEDDLAKTWNRFANTRFRFALPHTNQTIVDNVGIDFVMPNVADSGAAVTNYKAIRIPVMSGSGGTNFYGMFFENAPANGSIASANSYDLIFNAGVTGSGNMLLKVQSRTGLMLTNFNSSNNYLKMSASSNPLIEAVAGGSTAPLNFSAAGGSSLNFFTNSGTAQQLAITHVASTTAWVSIRGANGGNPRITASSNNLILGAGSQLATDATEGFAMFGAMAGTPTGLPVGNGNGQIAGVIDTSALKLWFHIAGTWRYVQLT